MAADHDSPGTRLLSLWGKLRSLPAGRWLFSRALGMMVPYSGSLGATVVHLEPGHCRIRLRDRRRVRNHLRSVHAIALVNVGELSSGLAMLTGLPPNVRGIVTEIRTEFLKKARGILIAECRCEIPTVTEPSEFWVIAEVVDRDDDVVSRTQVRWRLAPR